MSKLDEIEPVMNNDAILTPRTIDVFSALAITLKRIHIRLIAEGYIVKDGQIRRSKKLIAYEQDNKPYPKNK